METVPDSFLGDGYYASHRKCYPVEIFFLDTTRIWIYVYGQLLSIIVMLTRSSEYALQAMIYLAQQSDEQRVPGSQIAEHTQVPKKYLSKILGDLVRAGILDSAPGKKGGFRIPRSPKEIFLFEVLAPFEPVLAHRRPCPFGNRACSDDDPCAGHERWSEVRETYSRFLQGTSIYDISVRRDQRRRRQSKKRIRR